jgi:hypothetical protein
MTQPTNIDLHVWRNSDFPADPFTVAVNGVPTDLTGAVLKMQVRVRPDAGGDPILSLTSADASGNRMLILDPAAGTFRPVVAYAAWAAFTGQSPGKSWIGAYDIVLIKSGVTTTIAYGAFTVHPRVTAP